MLSVCCSHAATATHRCRRPPTCCLLLLTTAYYLLLTSLLTTSYQAPRYSLDDMTGEMLTALRDDK